MLIKGQKIANYIIDDDLGDGEFSFVYRAIDENNEKSVALKICKENINSSDIKRFKRENEILYILSPHKRIIKPYDKVTKEGDYYFFVMELADCALDKYLNLNYSLSFDDKIELFKKICEGVYHAHKKDIIHRDLWWKNVLMINNSNKAEPKLADFGRAKNFNGHYREYYHPQTVSVCEVIYPPENYFLIWEKADLEKYAYADIYALGIILYFIMGSEPVLYHNAINANILQFITQKKLKFSDLLSLSITERRNLYKEWQEQFDTYLIDSNLKVVLSDMGQEEKINTFIKKMCQLDYKKRYSNIDCLLKDLSK